MQTQRRRLLIAVLLGVAVGLPGGAAACTCAPVTPREAFARSTAVFVGQALTTVPRLAASGAVSSAATGPVSFRVWWRWKGSLPPTVDVSTARETVSCGYPFAQGQVYLVYAYGPESNLETNLCWRTRPLLLAGEDLVALQGEAVLAVTIAIFLVAGLVVFGKCRARARRARQMGIGSGLHAGG